MFRKSSQHIDTNCHKSVAFCDIIQQGGRKKATGTQLQGFLHKKCCKFNSTKNKLNKLDIHSHHEYFLLLGIIVINGKSFL